MSHRDFRAGERTITTLCRMCEQGCGLEVSLGPDGRPVRVKGDKNHPYSRGWLCVKGLAEVETPDPVSGFPNLKSNRCRIRKVSAPRE